MCVCVCFLITSTDGYLEGFSRVKEQSVTKKTVRGLKTSLACRGTAHDIIHRWEIAGGSDL